MTAKRHRKLYASVSLTSTSVFTSVKLFQLYLRRVRHNVRPGKSVCKIFLQSEDGKKSLLLYMIEAPHLPQNKDARKDSNSAPIHPLNNFTTARKQCDSNRHTITSTGTNYCTRCLLPQPSPFCCGHSRLAVQPLTRGLSTGFVKQSDTTSPEYLRVFQSSTAKCSSATPRVAVVTRSARPQSCY